MKKSRKNSTKDIDNVENSRYNKPRKVEKILLNMRRDRNILRWFVVILIIEYFLSHVNTKVDFFRKQSKGETENEKEETKSKGLKETEGI